MSDKSTEIALEAARKIDLSLEKYICGSYEISQFAQIVDEAITQSGLPELLEAARVFEKMALLADWGLDDLPELRELHTAIAKCEAPNE